MKTIIQTFHAASNFQNRIVFIEVYNKMAENFSRKFFKAHNLNELVIKLGDDKVPIVRKKVFENVVTIRRMLNQNDTVLIVKLDDTLNRARLDKNKTVSEVNYTRDFLKGSQAGKEALKELKSLTQYFFAEFEEEDSKRVSEEESLKEKEIRVIYLLYISLI